MLLHRPPRRGLISKEKLGRRLDMFARGEWIELFTASALCDEEVPVTCRRRQRRHGGQQDVERSDTCPDVGSDGRDFGRTTRVSGRGSGSRQSVNFDSVDRSHQAPTARARGHPREIDGACSTEPFLG